MSIAAVKCSSRDAHPFSLLDSTAAWFTGEWRPTSWSEDVTGSDGYKSFSATRKRAFPTSPFSLCTSCKAFCPFHLPHLCEFENNSKDSYSCFLKIRQDKDIRSHDEVDSSLVDHLWSPWVAFADSLNSLCRVPFGLTSVPWEIHPGVL